MQHISSFTLSALQDWMEQHGEKAFRAAQIYDWMYTHGAQSFEQMTNLGLPLRNKLSEAFYFPALKLVRTMESEDGETIKFLWELSDGKRVESVLICSAARRTVCVSCQVGCPDRCAFCATGKEGLLRNLTETERWQLPANLQSFSQAELAEQVDSWISLSMTISHLIQKFTVLDQLETMLEQ
ncbi:MAG: hypothetical protein K2X08_03770, partial [Chlamydiales bacterium]|nr:hypothetical protein [Chlamydiales bacterium]